MSQILKNDKITFTVAYLQNGKMYQVKTANYTYAYNTLVNLNRSAFLNFQAESKNSSVSASLMKRTKEGNLEVIHQHYLDAVLKAV